MTEPRKDTIDIASLHPNLIISPSKALKSLFTHMRDVNTSSPDFVKYSRRAMRILAEDALAELPHEDVTIQTPCGPYHQGVKLSIPITNVCAVSIIRSGDCLLEIVREIEPSVSVGKILIQRDESNPDKIAKIYYTKLPPSIKDNNDAYVILCDPMLATGGSAIVALDVLCGSEFKIPPENIIFANMICAPEGLKVLAQAYPKVKIVTACVDECLNEDKFIVPGLGDYGDRYFNT